MAKELDDELCSSDVESFCHKPLGEVTVKQKLKMCSCMIESTDMEQANLWVKYFEDLNWQQLSVDYHCIGHIDGDIDKPLNIKLTWARFHGSLVCFYDTTISEYIYSSTTDKWIDLHYSGPRCDTENFQNCIDIITAITEVRKPV